MLNPKYSSRFKKDLKLVSKRKYGIRKLFDLMTQLQMEEILDPSYQKHELIGKYRGFMECHIEPEWLLIYRVAEKRRQYILSVQVHTVICFEVIIATSFFEKTGQLIDV